ncbi:transposase [Bacillus subtilis subsp. subtilis]|nr:transposase [Bacillus subtilis subsp. subtilis]
MDFFLFILVKVIMLTNMIQNWLSKVPKELMTYFKNLIKSMNNWEEEIFNYFNSPITNAYTESLNCLIKTRSQY